LFVHAGIERDEDWQTSLNLLRFQSNFKPQQGGK